MITPGNWWLCDELAAWKRVVITIHKTHDLQRGRNSSHQAAACWFHPSAGAVVVATAAGNAPSKSWLSCCLARSDADLLRALETKCLKGAGEMRFYPAHAPFLPTLTCTVIYTSPGLPLKIREQLSTDYLIPSPRIPWTELSRGGCGEEEWSLEPFWVFVSVYFKMCLYLGSGLADTKVSVCMNVPMSSRPAQFMLPMEMFLKGTCLSTQSEWWPHTTNKASVSSPHHMYTCARGWENAAVAFYTCF